MDSERAAFLDDAGSEPIGADEGDQLVAERLGLPADDPLTGKLLDRVQEHLLQCYLGRSSAPTNGTFARTYRAKVPLGAATAARHHRR